MLASTLSRYKLKAHLTHLRGVYVLLALLFCSPFISCEETDSPGDYDIHKVLLPDNIFSEDSEYIAVIGDIQEYTGSPWLTKYLIHSLDWIRNQNRYFGKIKCVLQDGDLTWSNAKNQWDLADISFRHLCDSTLLIPCTGNHDYTWSEGSMIKDRNSTLLNNLTSVSLLDSSIERYYETGKRENIIVPVNISGKTYWIISLEFGPRKSVVEWAAQIVSENRDKKFILMTHEWLSAGGIRISEGSYAEIQFSTLSYSTPEEVWRMLVYPNDNILCVLCGHNGFCKYYFSENIAGRQVCQILFNLQYQENGGDSMIQLWEFPKGENVIKISVYNTLKRSFHTDKSTEIQINLN